MLNAEAADMNVKCELGESSQSQGAIEGFTEADKVNGDIVFVLQDETISDENDDPATESQPGHENGGDQEEKTVRVIAKPKPAYKRVELCIMDKIRVIAAGSTGLSQRQIAKQFGISKTQVQTLLKRKEEVLRCYNEGTHGWRKRANNKSRPYILDDIDELVSIWYSEHKNRGEVTGVMVKEKATEISVELGLRDKFKASDSWLECLKRTYNIQTIRDKNSYSSGTASENPATMVSLKRTKDPVSQHCSLESNFKRGRNKEPGIERTDGLNQDDVNELRPEPRVEPKESSIPTILSIQPPHPEIHSIHSDSIIHSGRPRILPSSHKYQQQQASQKVRPACPHPAAANNLQTLAEIVGQEANIRMEVRSYSEALRFASALKSFAVEMGSVTLIGLMTAMEHELQREKRNYCLDDRDAITTTGPTN